MLRSGFGLFSCFVLCISGLLNVGEGLDHGKCNGSCTPFILSEKACKADLVPNVCGSPDLICCPHLEHESNADPLNLRRKLLNSPIAGLEKTLADAWKRPQRDTYFNLLRVLVSEALKSPPTPDKDASARIEDTATLPTSTSAPDGHAATKPITKSATTKTEMPFTLNISTTGALKIKSAPNTENLKAATQPAAGDSSSQTATPTGVNRQEAVLSTPSSPLQSAVPPVSTSVSKLTTQTTPELTTQHFNYPCPGSCVGSFFAYFCDLQTADYHCPEERVCCLPLTTTTTELPPIGPCPGTCLHPQLTGLCRRPARLLLKTTTCDPQSICCTETPRIW